MKPTFSRRFTYLFVIIFFVCGSVLGWANGEYRARDFQVQAEGEFFRGVYVLCMAWAINLNFAPMLAAIDQCTAIVQNGYDIEVQNDLQYNQGYVRPK